MAHSAGIKSVPINLRLAPNVFRDKKHRDDFISACHRGYDKSQTKIVSELKSLYQEKELSSDEVKFRELVLRRIIDSIAHLLFLRKTHFVRRVVLHDEIPTLNFDVISQAITQATRMNRESRLTFALLADLSTFIHVADILRIDFRKKEGFIQLIELKTGTINEILLAKLDEYAPNPESLEAIRSDASIDERFKKQAARMQRQRIRTHQIKETLTKDEGLDIKTKIPIRLIGPEVSLDSFDKIIDDLCKRALAESLAAVTIDRCLHIGAAYSNDVELVKGKAFGAARYLYDKRLKVNEPGWEEVKTYVSANVPENERLWLTDLLMTNLYAFSGKPFVLWGINPQYMVDLVSRKLVLVMGFDIASFVWLCRHLGIRAEFTTRREAEQATQNIRRKEFAMWGNRLLHVRIAEREFNVGMGIISRFFHDLTAPSHYLILQKEEREGFEG